jgi:UDP-2,3-diacylglucosamine hydrolase
MKIQQYLKSPTFLKEGAVFIADSHYSKQNQDLKKLLLKIKNNKIKTEQIFLVGDIFHLLLPFKFLVEYNQEVINLINELSKTKEVYYFEGNHDFCLDGIFVKEVKILKELKKDGVCINHGDIYIKDKFYKFYTSFIRNKFTMKIVNIVTLNFVNNWMFRKLLNKYIRCDEMNNFTKLAEYKISQYNCDFIIEGHYHQNKIYKNYLNLPSLYCQNSFLQLKNNKFIEIFI